MRDPYKDVSASLLVKLGSAIVHADEAMSVDGHALDRQAFYNLLHDPEVVKWMTTMGKLAFLPVKRRK